MGHLAPAELHSSELQVMEMGTVCLQTSISLAQEQRAFGEKGSIPFA